MDIVVIVMGVIAVAAGVGGFIMEHGGGKKDKNSKGKENTEA